MESLTLKEEEGGKVGGGGHCERMHSKIVFADFRSDVSQAVFAFFNKKYLANGHAFHFAKFFWHH